MSSRRWDLVVVYRVRGQKRYVQSWMRQVLERDLGGRILERMDAARAAGGHIVRVQVTPSWDSEL